MSWEEREAVMRAARDRFSRDEVAELQRSCIYHQVDWPAVAARACELVEAHGPELRWDAVDKAAATLEEPARSFLVSLFWDPINWWSTSKIFTNGQHRACGLFLGGAKRVPVLPGRQTLEAYGLEVEPSESRR
jgi:hypothetical protein